MFQKFLLSKRFLWIRVGWKEGASRFSIKNLLSHSTEKPRRGTPLCFRKLLVSKIVREKKGGGYRDFPLKLFCLTVPKRFVEEPFAVSESFVYRKFLCISGGYHEFFLSHSTEILSGATLLCLKKILVSKIFMH